jgi:cobalt-zinc-cadmium efflux system outer membrane protein
MHRNTSPARTRWHRAALAAALCGLAPLAWAQASANAPASTLGQAYAAAWARQPEALALEARRDATRAQQQAAGAWTPEPVALELSAKSDRLNRNLGAREYEVGVAVPLWLPGERARSQTLAQAEGRAAESRALLARLRVAAAVREAWWALQRTHAEVDAARSQLDSARRIAADVARRVRAGDLARADQHQADGAVAAAEAALAHADAEAAVASQRLLALTALPTLASSTAFDAEPEPVAADIDIHGELLALQDRAAVADSAAALAATQTRANPELLIAATRDRGSFGESVQQTFTLGLRIPFGAGPRHDARRAAARAEAIELQAQLQLDKARLTSERSAAQLRTAAARAQLVAADRRAQLARETRGFFDKSFSEGQTDLPTRLRIEAEAAEAERQALRARIELAASISAWRQALGLLPL